jgi:hypothetical protein
LLRIASGSTVATGAGFTFIAGTGTVEYYRIGAQTVAPVIYNNLALWFRYKTVTGITINKVLAMEGAATVGSAYLYSCFCNLTVQHIRLVPLDLNG